MFGNKGMYLETLINRTIQYFNSNESGFIEKRNIPFSIIGMTGNGSFNGRLLDKSTVDYCGLWKGKHFEFEAKQTSKAYFNLDLIKKHQWEYLVKVLEYGAVSFVIIHFDLYEETYLIQTGEIVAYLKNNKARKMDYSYIKEKGRLLEVTYPGILNFINLLY